MCNSLTAQQNCQQSLGTRTFKPNDPRMFLLYAQWLFKEKACCVVHQETLHHFIFAEVP